MTLEKNPLKRELSRYTTPSTSIKAAVCGNQVPQPSTHSSQGYGEVLDHIRARDVLNQAEKFTDWEWFHSLASDLISPRIQINSGEEADKAAHDLTASVTSACRLSTRKLTLLDQNNNLPSLHQLQKQK